MDKKALRKVIEDHPLLCEEGYGLADPFGEVVALPSEERRHEFNKRQQALLNDVAGFKKACAWLRGKEQTKFVDKRRNPSSYDLKHIAEREIGYISNGAFIAAAIHCGFQILVIPDSPNVVLNVSLAHVGRQNGFNKSLLRFGRSKREPLADC